MYVVDCPRCIQTSVVPDTLVGKSVRCIHCGYVFETSTDPRTDYLSGAFPINERLAIPSDQFNPAVDLPESRAHAASFEWDEIHSERLARDLDERVSDRPRQAPPEPPKRSPPPRRQPPVVVRHDEEDDSDSEIEVVVDPPRQSKPKQERWEEPPRKSRAKVEVDYEAMPAREFPVMSRPVNPQVLPSPLFPVPSTLEIEQARRQRRRKKMGKSTIASMFRVFADADVFVDALRFVGTALLMVPVYFVFAFAASFVSQQNIGAALGLIVVFLTITLCWCGLWHSLTLKIISRHAHGTEWCPDSFLSCVGSFVACALPMIPPFVFLQIAGVGRENWNRWHYAGFIFVQLTISIYWMCIVSVQAVTQSIRPGKALEFMVQCGHYLFVAFLIEMALSSIGVLFVAWYMFDHDAKNQFPIPVFIAIFTGIGWYLQFCYSILLGMVGKILAHHETRLSLAD